MSDGSDGPSDGRPDVRIVAGGALDAVEEAAIVAAVTRLVRRREQERSAAPSAWARAGRWEASGARTVRARDLLPPA